VTRIQMFGAYAVVTGACRDPHIMISYVVEGILAMFDQCCCQDLMSSRDRDWDLGIEVSRPRPIETFALRSRDQYLGKMNTSALESRHLGLEITLTLLVGSFNPQKPVPDMTYNVFSVTLNPTPSINLKITTLHTTQLNDPFLWGFCIDRS